jgi:hypothetical protein
MLKRIIILGTVALSATGCVSGHRVYVNGYAEPDESIERSAKFFVATDPNSPNPIFEKQIKKSAEALLASYGYTVTSSAEKATYRIRFQAGMNSETVMGYTPSYQAHFGVRGGYPGRYGVGYSMQTPYFDTIYDQWLMLRLSRIGVDGPNGEKPVWVGEAMISTDRAELRETVNYLLIGCIEYLGVDTGRKVAVKIRKDDPRLLAIADQ